MKVLYSRELEESDLEVIKTFDQENILPYLSDPFTFKKIIIEDDNGIILVGLRRVVNEYKFIHNSNRSNSDIALAIKEVFGPLFKDTVERVPNDIYAIIMKDQSLDQGTKLSNLLIKHFGFLSINAIPLILEV